MAVLVLRVLLDSQAQLHDHTRHSLAVTNRRVVMLCDQRLRTRAYGRIFLDSLPPMPRTERLDEVEQFLFAKLATVGVAAALSPLRAAP